MPNELTLQVVSVGPDWYTATAVTDDQCVGLLAVWRRWCKAQPEETLLAKDWSRLGYKGSTVNGLSFGMRNESEAMMIGSGEVAQALLPGDLPRDVRLTRFDVQVTIMLAKPLPLLAHDVYDDVTAGNDARVKARYVRLIKSRTGDTLYLNKRSAPVMLRLYDKGHDYNKAQKGEFWRYEVEYKAKAAIAAYQAWLTCQHHENWCLGAVLSEFRKRGVEAHWPVSNDISAIAIKATVTTSAGKLQWLSRCVSPVVVQLIQAGLEGETLAALKLHHFRPNDKE